MKESTTEILSESCIGCKYQHITLGTYRCYKTDQNHGDFISYIGTYLVYPKPLNSTCYEEDK